MTGMRSKYVYGPVSSWRLGRSLGIDPVYTPGSGKACSFDCEYCQAGKTRFLTNKRKIFIPTRNILEEIKSLPPLKIDYITFSGRGEPTLARNLGAMIKGIKKVRKEKIAVLTNSTLLGRKSVRRDLAEADFVVAKLDAHSEKLLKGIDSPARTVKLKNIVKGIKTFKAGFRGKFAVQLMFTSKNKKYAENIAALVRKIKPDVIYINTPLRPSKVKPLPKKALKKIKNIFKTMNPITVYETALPTA